MASSSNKSPNDPRSQSEKQASPAGPSTTGTSSSTRELPGQPWQRPTSGAWLLVLLAVLALVGLVLASGVVWQPDERGEDDAGVVHPQPLGVDDDVAPRYGDS